MRILVDMDGVINLFDEHFISFVKRQGYDFDEYNFNHNGDWDISQFIITSDNQKKIMNTICIDMSFWDTIPPIPGAIEVLRDINKKHEIKIVTTPWKDDEKFRINKIKWMKKYFSFIGRNQIIFSNKKWEVPGDVIIEDKPETIVNSNEFMYTLCHDQPYNKNCNPDYRFSNWNVVPGILQKIEREVK